MVSFQPRSPGAGRAPATPQHLERRQVQVHRVVQIGHQPPDLDVPEPRRRRGPASGSNGRPFTVHISGSGAAASVAAA